MTIRVPCIATLALLLSVSAGVSAMDDTAANALLAAGGCNACHALEQKMLGPSYTDIAAKYKGDASAAAMLVERVRNGSSGAWGQIPMLPVPSARIGDGDLGAVLAWVLAR